MWGAELCGQVSQGDFLVRVPVNPVPDRACHRRLTPVTVGMRIVDGTVFPAFNLTLREQENRSVPGSMLDHPKRPFFLDRRAMPDADPDISPRGLPFGAVARPRRAGGACYRRTMSPEALTSIATGSAFAALHVGLFAELRADTKHGYTRLRCSVALVNQGEHSQRRAAAVVGYIVRNFTVDGSLISSKGMGERQLLGNDSPEAAVNRRVEIRSVTRAR